MKEGSPQISGQIFIHILSLPQAFVMVTLRVRFIQFRTLSVLSLKWLNHVPTPKILCFVVILLFERLF